MDKDLVKMEATFKQKSAAEHVREEMPVSRELCASLPSPFGMSTAWNLSACVPTASMLNSVPLCDTPPILY